MFQVSVCVCLCVCVCVCEGVCVCVCIFVHTIRVFVLFLVGSKAFKGLGLVKLNSFSLIFKTSMKISIYIFLKYYEKNKQTIFHD